MKKIFGILFLSITLLFSATQAKADLFSVYVSYSDTMGGSTMQKLADNVTKLAEEISTASASMMKLGDMLQCNGKHGHVAYVEKEILGHKFSLKLLGVNIWLCGVILYIIGFFVMMMSSFYMFDVAFNLAISITILPLGLALWPFAWTREKLRTIIQSIAYYVGLFMFLPLGILIAKTIAVEVIDSSISEFGGNDFWTAYNDDQTDVLTETFSIISLSFFKIVISFIVAIKVIPLMADEFCTHFFGNSLVGAPMSDHIKTQIDKLKKQAGRVGGYGKDVFKHQAGKFLQNHSSGAISRYGKNLKNSTRK